MSPVALVFDLFLHGRCQFNLFHRSVLYKKWPRLQIRIKPSLQRFFPFAFLASSKSEIDFLEFLSGFRNFISSSRTSDLFHDYLCRFSVYLFHSFRFFYFNFFFCFPLLLLNRLFFFLH